MNQDTGGPVFTTPMDRIIRRLGWSFPIAVTILLVVMAIGGDRREFKANTIIIANHEARIDVLERQFERNTTQLANIDNKLEKIIFALREHRSESGELETHE